MNKNFLKEMILPSFWLFFFIVYSNIPNKDNQLDKQTKLELKNMTGSAGNSKSIVPGSKTTLTGAVYIHGY